MINYSNKMSSSTSYLTFSGISVIIGAFLVLKSSITVCSLNSSPFSSLSYINYIILFQRPLKLVLLMSLELPFFWLILLFEYFVRPLISFFLLHPLSLYSKLNYSFFTYLHEFKQSSQCQRICFNAFQGILRKD